MTESFKPRLARNYLGTYRAKIDGLEKASGRAKYADDLTIESKFPGMLYAKFLRSPYPRARIKHVDTSKADALPGVKEVITYADPEIAALPTTNQSWTDGGNSLNYERMWWPLYRDRRFLSDYVCWVGDEAGVAIAAESEEIAEDALKLVQVQWEVLPFVLNMEEAMKPGAPVIHPEISSNNNVLPPDKFAGPDVVIERGDLAAGFAKDDVVVEAKTRYSTPTQGVLDKWICVVDWNRDNLTVWSNSYEPDQTRMYLSDVFHLPLNKVRVISPYVGAQMGRGDCGEQTFYVIAALLSKRTGRAVKFRHTRRETFQNTRTGMIGYCKMGAKKDGTVDTVHLKQTGDMGAYVDMAMASVKFVPQNYIQNCLLNVTNLKFEGYGVYTNRIPSSIMRGIGHIQPNFITVLAVDMLAEKLDMDPVELVLKNFGWPPLPNKSLKAVLDECAKRIGWSKRHKAGEGSAIGGKKRGLGFSFHNGWHAAWQELRRGAIQVMIRVNPDGTVNLDAPTVETGTGSNTCAVLACADSLGVKVSDVHWTSTVDTETSMKDQVQTDSAVSYVLAEGIHLAAQDAKRQILEIAATELKTPASSLDIKDGRIYVKEAQENGIALSNLLMKGDLVPIMASSAKPLPAEVTGVPYLATFADVEVDTDTGEVRVCKLVIANDLGTVMYPAGAEGQQVGGQCMGLGEALSEEVIYDEETGVPLNFDLLNYKIPMMRDFPEIEPIVMEVWKGAGEYGACGMGEAVLACTPRAVANAVYNAIGARVDDLPITPAKVLKVLGKI